MAVDRLTWDSVLVLIDFVRTHVAPSADPGSFSPDDIPDDAEWAIPGITEAYRQLDELTGGPAEHAMTGSADSLVPASRNEAPSLPPASVVEGES